MATAFNLNNIQAISIETLPQEALEEFMLIRKKIHLQSEFDNLVSEEVEHYYEAYFNSPFQMIFVARYKNEIIGYCAYHREERECSQHVAYIEMGVLEEYRGKGVGTALENWVENYVINKGVRKLLGITLQNNMLGISFCTKLNFRIEGKLKSHIHINDEYYDCYMMGKWLNT